jgi:GNAT superfamily N-acetyltransferase
MALDYIWPETPMRISLATPEELQSIRTIRRSVYALELGQPLEVVEDAASAALESASTLIVACDEAAIVGFVAITPPGSGAYAVERYFPRETVPIAFDDGLYEIRILTVAPQHRGRPVALALAFAALRWVEHHGGRHVVAVGRVDLLSFYRRLGLVPLDLRTVSHEIEFELVHAAVPVLRRRATVLGEQIARLRETVQWDLPIPFDAA